MDLKNIKDLRKAKGYSIQQVSDKTGINRDRISLIERGKVNPSFNTVVDIVNAIGAKLILSYE